MNRREMLKTAAALVGLALAPEDVSWLEPQSAWVERIWTEPAIVESSFVTNPVIRHLIGHRRDGRWFYVAVPHRTMSDALICAKFDRENAENVLATFSDCACTEAGQCETHAMMFPLGEI